MYRVTTLIVLLFLVSSSHAAFDSIDNSTNSFMTISENASGVKLNVNSVNAELHTIVNGGIQWQTFNFENSGVVAEDGGPALPAFSKWVEVPEGFKPVLRISNLTTYHIDNVKLAPLPTLQSDNVNLNQTQSSPSENPTLYTNNSWYPEQNASISEVVNVLGKRVVALDVTPYRYNAYLQQLEVAEGYEVEVIFEYDNSKSEHAHRFNAPVYQELLNAMGLRSGPKRDGLSGAVDNLGHLVVVIPENDNVRNAIAPLVDWKKRKGYLVTVVDLGETGNSVNDIRNYLRDAYFEWEYPPNFVLMVGDHNGNVSMPTFRDERGGQGGWHASDNPFVQFIGERDFDLWLPEAFIGRLSVANVQELTTVVNKILAYEKTPFMEDDWFEGGVLIANGVQSSVSTNQTVRELMTNAGYSRDNIYEAYADYHQGQRPDHNRINNGCNTGVGFVNFRGYQTWGDYTVNQIRNLSNGSKLPVVTGMVCGTNDFTNSWGDTQPESRGEGWLRAGSPNDLKGGVACYGPTDLYTHTWFNNTQNAEIYHLLLNKGVSTLGALTLGGKLAIHRNYPSRRNYGNGQSTSYYIYTYTLLGDPTMQVWSKTPKTVTIEFEDEIPAGTSKLSYLVFDEEENPVSGAYVHIYCPDNNVQFGGYTDENGSIELSIAPLLEGEYQLTVTGRNLVPVIEQFNAVNQSVFLAFENVEIIDNEFIRAGNDYSLNLTLKNVGSQRSEATEVELNIDYPFVEVLNGTVSYDALDSDATSSGNGSFEIRVSPQMPKNQTLIFTLRYRYNESEHIGSFTLQPKAYDFQIISHSFVREELLPGTVGELMVEVKNNSPFASNDVTATIFSNDPMIQIRQNRAFLGRVPVDEGRDNGQHLFEILASPFAYPVSNINLGLLISDQAGLKDSLTFQITLGGDVDKAPQQDEGYGYWAFDTRDTTGGMAPEYNWIDGSTRLNLSDNDDRANYSGVHGMSTTVELPFDFVYYGEVFSEISISTNGWMAFGRSELVAFNNQEMGSALAPASQLAIYWQDLFNGQVWTHYDEDNARFVVEWRGFNNTYGENRFAIHLYDPRTVITANGDGEFHYVYHTINLGIPAAGYVQEGVTIGFTCPERERGMTLAHAGTWDPRSRGLASRMAIRFTTGEFTERGNLEGRIVDAGTNEPISGVRVMLEGTGFQAISTQDGSYLLEYAPTGTYNIVASKPGYNNGITADVQIIEDETIEANFSLTHPTFNIEHKEIVYGILADTTGSIQTELWNEGNGPLDFKVALAYQDENIGMPWTEMFNLSATTIAEGNSRLSGITSDKDYYYVTGAVRQSYPHQIYVIDREGNLVRTIPQYTVDSSAINGYTSLSFNGVNLLGADKSNVVEINLEGELVSVIDNPDNIFNVVTAVPERGTMITKSTTGRIFYELDYEGNVITTYSAQGNEAIRTYGLQWYEDDPDGYKLYMFAAHRDPAVAGTSLQMLKMNTETSDVKEIRLIRLEDGDSPLGITITKYHNPLVWTIAAMVNRGDDDRLVGFELTPNLSWINFEPSEGTIEANERQVFNIEFNSSDMPEREYNIILRFYHNAIGDIFNLPVTFIVGEEVVVDDLAEVLVPTEFAFLPSYPNPFNNATRLSFSLPETQNVSISIYNINGRLVETMQYSRVDAGTHNVVFNANQLSSGVYFAKLTAGKHSAIQKLVLMK